MYAYVFCTYIVLIYTYVYLYMYVYNHTSEKHVQLFCCSSLLLKICFGVLHAYVQTDLRYFALHCFTSWCVSGAFYVF